jgi:hypothetical protein
MTEYGDDWVLAEAKKQYPGYDSYKISHDGLRKITAKRGDEEITIDSFKVYLDATKIHLKINDGM